YPEAVALACLFASPAWRALAAGGPAGQQQFTRRIGQLLGQPGYQPHGIDDPIAHWMTYDSWRPPSRPHTTFPQTRAYGSVPPAPTHPTRPKTHRPARPSVRWPHPPPPRRQRPLAPPPQPAGPDPRLVTQDGRHHRNHLGQPNHAAPRASRPPQYGQAMSGH